MTSPDLNRKLVLEAKTRIADGAGGFQETWQDLGGLWGAISPGAGRMSSGFGGAMSQGKFDILVRGAPHGHSNRPEPGQRLRMGNRVFFIHAVTEREPRGMYLICETREEVAV